MWKARLRLDNNNDYRASVRPLFVPLLPPISPISKTSIAVSLSSALLRSSLWRLSHSCIRDGTRKIAWIGSLCERMPRQQREINKIVRQKFEPIWHRFRGTRTLFKWIFQSRVADRVSIFLIAPLIAVRTSEIVLNCECQFLIARLCQTIARTDSNLQFAMQGRIILYERACPNRSTIYEDKFHADRADKFSARFICRKINFN